MKSYDAIIIGAGPNGFTCGSYLAKAGAKVLILERNAETGGGLASEEHSGFRFNYHAIYMMLGELMPPYHDFNLRERGVIFTKPDTQVAFLFQDGKSFVLYVDPEKSKKSLAKLSSKDAETFGRMMHEFKEMCDHFLIPATYFPPVEPLRQIPLLENAGDTGKKILQISEMTPREVVASYKYEDPRIEAAFLYLATMFGIDPEAGGMGFMVPLYVYRLMNTAIVRGGTHSLSSAIRAEFEANGGEVENSAEVKSLITEKGEVKGVRLNDGREIFSKVVISSLNPEQTFFQLYDRKDTPAELAESIENWKWEEWSYFTSHIAVIGDAPRYEAYDSEVNSALIVVMGYESPEEVVQHGEAIKRGELPEKVAGHGTCTTIFDPLQAPSHPYGPYHTLRWECWAPYELKDSKDWDDVKKDYGDRCFETWCHYAPNLAKQKINRRIDWSPVDIERRLITMKKGSIKHGAYSQFQMGYNRPSADCSDYRTPIKGLYVCGASVHPGGMVILGPGYNAAKRVAEDLGLQIWWKVPEMVQKAQEEGYLPR